MTKRATTTKKPATKKPVAAPRPATRKRVSRETSPKVAATAAKLMKHDDPEVRSVAGSAVVQAAPAAPPAVTKEDVEAWLKEHNTIIITIADFEQLTAEVVTLKAENEHLREQVAWHERKARGQA